ncbi:hypothetical protein DFH28DRAFT_401509 [Melampsora americana]|nr:hypothetical protein DFH28DRAFT_401509 [Melampsora americana]
MTISNDLDSNLALLSRISTDGQNQSNQLNFLLKTTSQSCLDREDYSVPLREFIEIFLDRYCATQFTSGKHRDSKHGSRYLKDVDVAADVFRMHIDHYPENINETIKTDHLLIAINFIVTTMLPMNFTEPRLIVLNSPTFEKYSLSMQFFLELQIMTSYIAVGELLNAKTFLNKMISRSNTLSDIPEFISIQDSLSGIEPEPQISPEIDSTYIDDSPAIVDSYVDQNHDVMIEEDMIDIKPDVDQIQNPAESSRKQYNISDDDKPALNTISNSFDNREQIVIIDEDMSDTKPYVDQIQRPKRSSRKRHITSDDVKPPINTRSNSSSNQNQVVISDEDLSDSKPLQKHIKRPKRASRKREDSSDEDGLLLGNTSIINSNRPKLDDIISRMSELIEDLQNSKGVSKRECMKMFETLDERRRKIRSVKYVDKKVPKSDQHMRTYQMYRDWCAKHKFSELPITFDKAFLWAELCLRSYSVHHLKMMRRIRELNWFRGETLSSGSDDISFWPDSFWNDYFEDERFPHVFTTKGGDPRRVAYPRKNINQMNKFPAPLPPQRKRPKPSTSLSPKARLKSESRSVSCESIPEVMILDEEPSPRSMASKITLNTDLESRQDMNEAKYVIPTHDTWPEPIDKIDFDALKKPKHITRNRSKILDQLRWESGGVIVKPRLFADAFWKYKTDGITPLEKFGKREESIRTLDKYLDHCERNSIKAFPVTKMKIYLLFMEDFPHLALSTTRNYARYFCHAIEMIKIIIPDLAGNSITLDELRASKLWTRWLNERKEHDQSRN